jgi:signal transduction histidine kinase/CheY-like chemotaxis protein
MPAPKLTPRFILPAAIAMILFGFALSLNFVANRQYQKSLEWVGHSHEVIAKMNRIVALVRESEGTARLLPFSSEPNLRAQLNDLFSEVQINARELQDLVIDNPSQQKRASEIAHMISYEFGDILKENSLRRRTRPEEADFPIADRWLPLLNKVKASADEFIAAEESFLAQRRNQYQHIANVTSVSLGLCLFFAAVVIISGTLVVRRTIRVLEQSAELERAKNKAVEADQHKTEFLANMSHEIRTPMNSVLGFADLLRKTRLDEDQERYVGAIQTGGKTLLALINDILDISKIEAGQFVPQLAPTSLREQFSSIKTIFAEQARRKDLTLDLEVAPGVPASLLFEPTRLRQILLNLVGNAIKFTDQGGVCLKARCQPHPEQPELHDLVIEVIDTGRGIASHNLERIFKPFEQVRAGASPQRGTGLGLSITKRLTEFLHGTIEVTSEVGQGTTFRLQFPRVPLANASPVTSPGLPSPNLAQIHPSRILIVDDVPLNRDLMQGIFRETRHEIIVASDGLEAIAKAKEESPDVILMDIRMPRMSGREARRELLNDPQTANIPVIAVTASSMLAEERELRETFQGYLRKPFTFEELFGVLAKVIPVTGEEETSTTAPSAEAHAPAESFTNHATGAPPHRAELSDDHFPSPSEDSFWESLVTESPSLQSLAAELSELSELHQKTVRSPSREAVAQFAETVRKFAEKEDCHPVKRWGELLLRRNEKFKVAATETQLAEFPLLVENLKRRIPHH